MKLTFLEAADGTRLSKTITPTETKSYPNVKAVTSHEVVIKDADLAVFADTLRTHANKGHCLLKGPLRTTLNNESRKGATDNVAYCDFVVIDLDNVRLPGFKVPRKMTREDVVRIAGIAVALLPEIFHNVSYIAQASSSLGFKEDRVSMHLYFLLKTPLPPKTVKMWLRSLNLSITQFEEQVQLSASGNSLRYVVDPSVADNSKLIFIAPPVFSDKELDPFADADDRIAYVECPTHTVELASLLSKINPEILNGQIHEKKETLRVAQGLPRKKAKLTIVSYGDSQIEVISNPDRLSINVVDESNYPYIRCNINGGDSGAYWFNADDPTFMLNFKDEPAFSIEKADPEFYATLFERYSERGAKKKHPTKPVVMRDFYTDTYWNGVFDPNTHQFTEEYPLTATTKGSVEGFMKSHGRAVPAFIPDAKVVFDPARADDIIQMDNPPYYVNMYTQSEYMLGALPPPGPLKYGTGFQLRETCPTIYKIIYHMLGSAAFETEHFINWLAFIYQNKTKSMTAWILTGVPGTGKGLFVNKILKPLFTQQHVAMRAMENLEEQFNLYMRSALFLVVDEFRMADARNGLHRMADKLKNMITEPNLTIRGMRANQVELPSYTNFLFLTNRADAVKIEEGDRRYNVGPRQEKKILDVHPELVGELDYIEGELAHFAGALQTYIVDKRMAQTCMNNAAKNTMRAVTMSVHEEFLDAYRSGDFAYFTDVMDISVNNTFEAGSIIGAQKIVRQWLQDARGQGWSITTPEQLRTVYLAYAQPLPPPSPREFNKTCQRAGFTAERKRPGKDNAVTNQPIRGYVTTWATQPGELDAYAEDYLEPREKIDRERA